MILALFSNTDPTLEALFFTIAALVHVKFLADIKDKIAQLFSGIKIQIQSPIEVDHTNTKSVNTDPQPVSPVTDTSTNTPAASKTLSTEPKEETAIAQ